MTCTTDAFEEEGEAPVIPFELVVSTGEGGRDNDRTRKINLN
jgi:hypothetical protein